MTRKILVTGGAGFIGSHVCKLLACTGSRPVVYDDLSTGHRDLVRWGPLIEGDIRDQERLERAIAAHRPDVVMHFAAKSEAVEAACDPDVYRDVNVGGTAALLGAMKRAGCRNLVISSSAAVYGRAAEAPITEARAVDPITPYGRTKAMAEDLALSAAGTNALVLRYFDTTGADPEGGSLDWSEPRDHLVPLVIEAAAGRRASITVFGRDHATPDGTAVRDYVHVMDIASAHVHAARHLRRGGRTRTINLGSGRGTSVDEIIRAARRVTRRDITSETGTRRDSDPAYLTADATLAQQVLGWRPRRSTIKRILADAWATHPGRQRLAA